MMYHTVFLALLFSQIGVPGWCASRGNAWPTARENLTDIYLINPLPYPDNSSFAGWDRGFELIPAGQLAEEQINNRSDILPGYRLNLINIDSEACGISDGLVNFFRPLMDPNVLSVGVVGLFCSSVTNTIAPVAGHPGIDYIQVAGSTSPRHRNSTEYPRLFHAISSSVVFNEAAFKLMEMFNWKKVHVIHDSRGLYFRTTAEDFIHKLNSERDYTLLSRTPISNPSDISITTDILNVSGGRIVYGSLTVPQAAMVVCEAYRRKFLWPAFAYIFHDCNLGALIEEVIDNSEMPCSVRELKDALEGTFSLQYKLELDNVTALESGLNYAEYKELYLQRLADFSIKKGMNLTDNSYANVLYDEVWAFALALNRSLDTLDSMNLTLESYGFGDVTVSDIIQEQLLNLSFQGASGLMQFSRADRESRTSVNIFQIQNGKSVLVAIYSPYEQKLLPLENEEFLPDEPEDTFGVVYELSIGLVYAIFLFVISGLGYVLTTAVLVMFIYWRKQPEIKASSPYLSLTMFAGCYLLITAAVVRTLSRFSVTVIENTTIFDVICNIELWFGILGLNMIYATLFIRLLRIFYVFKQFRKTSKYWADKYLLLGVLAVMSPLLVALVVWTATDHVRQLFTTRFDYKDPPYYETRATCDSDMYNFNTWVVSMLAYSAITFGLAALFAVLTRHIKRENFKDTKKVNIFVAITIFMLVLFLILLFVCESADKCHLFSFFLSLIILSIPLNCQLCLFVPKTLPQLFKLEAKQLNMHGTKTLFANDVSWHA